VGDQTTPPADARSPACVEQGVWTPLPVAPPTQLNQFTLRLREAHRREHERITAAGAMTFHLVGCAGDFSAHAAQRRVARVMATQARDPGTTGLRDGSIRRASFFYLLGDVVYKDENKADLDGDDQRTMYRRQFYAPYASYRRRIFAIAGNHDGKQTAHSATSAIDHFLANFCATSRERSPDNTVDQRAAMTQPYVYWRLTTPLAYIIGLYSNIANGGILDDPAQPDVQPQYRWLVEQLTSVREKNARRAVRRAVLVAVHYPPYSGARNFAQRGDPTLGPSQATGARPLATVLQQAFAESGQRPDAIVSAHAHLYQRLTYHYADGWELPCLIVGSGGHAPIESLGTRCDGTTARPKQAPFDAVLPPGVALPSGEQVRVAAYNSSSFGFMRLTVATNTLVGEFFAVDGERPALTDAFRLDLGTHRLENARQ
jgi:hypothetical protein